MDVYVGWIVLETDRKVLTELNQNAVHVFTHESQFFLTID